MMYLVLDIQDPALATMMRDTYGIKGYIHLPSISDLTDQEIKETVTGGCKGWVTNIDAMHWPNPALVGGTSKGPDGIYDHGSAIFTSMLLADTNVLSGRLNIDVKEANRVLGEFKEKVRSGNEAIAGASFCQVPRLTVCVPISSVRHFALAPSAACRVHVRS
jgi:hypothetical protein